MRNTLALIIALLLTRPTGLYAAIYHVDSIQGLDAASGKSPAEAWQSLEKVNATIFQPGDRLLFKAGAVWKGRLHPKGSGNAAQWIVVDRYGTGPQPIIHGDGIPGGAVFLENQQYWSVRNLEITNQGTKGPRTVGILIRNNSVGMLSGIEVKDCTIHSISGDLTDYKDGKESGGIVFSITAGNLSVPSWWDDVRIENNTVRDVAREGILLQSQWINKPRDPNSSWRGHGAYTPSTKVRIADNRLERIAGDGIVLWCVRGALVERNFVRQANNNSLKQGHAAIWPYFCENVVFQYNEVCETRTKFDGMAFDFDNSNQRCVYQYNFSHDNEGGFLNMCCDGKANANIARYNISQNDGCLAGSRVFLVHGNGNQNYLVHNNTIYAGRGNPAMFEQGADSSGSSILFQNNIFFNTGTGTLQAPKGCRFERNLYFGSGHVADDAKKILANPLLLAPGSGRSGLDAVAGYQLMSGSPALQAGMLIPDNGGRDYWGNPVSTSAAPHLGAFNGPPVKPGKQVPIPWVDKMPRLPRPLHVVNWKQIATDYYHLVFDPAAVGKHLPAVVLSPEHSRFSFPSYLVGHRPITCDQGEAIGCLPAVLGAQLLGMNMETFQGINWVNACQRWFSDLDGIYRNGIGQKGGLLSHVIYGYWPPTLGMMLADVNPHHPVFQKHFDRQATFLLQMARDMGCPQAPNLKQAYDIARRQVAPIGTDWNPGNASCLAWILYAGYQKTGQEEFLQCARAALRWHLENPGRYEISHGMGPLVMARLNAEHGDHWDMIRMMDNWFGDYTRLPGFQHQWGITHHTNLGGMTCDGLDGAWWRRPDDNGFYAFAMGSFQGPAWLVPTARYDQRFARSIARYALHAANSCRFFLGIDLDPDHQDHLEWRKSLPREKGFLFSYEGLRTEAHHADAQHAFQPYATGDPLALFSRKYQGQSRKQYWNDRQEFTKSADNIALYMGNHIGFLGAICRSTDVPGILVWDLTRTDYFRPKCYPSYLIYNPHESTKTIHFDVGVALCDLYDTVSGDFLKVNVRGEQAITLEADQVVVLVLAPARGDLTQKGHKLKINDVVVDYHHP